MRRALLQPRVLWFSLLGVVLIVFPYAHGWPLFDGSINNLGFFTVEITEFRTFNLTMFGVWFLVVMSMNLLTGSSGQISLGHAAVVLVGAYTTGILFVEFGVPLALAVIVAGVFTGVVGGVLIGLPGARLAGPYLAIATFSLIITMPQILKLNGIDSLTNGALGIGIRPVEAPDFVNDVLGAVTGGAVAVDGRQWIYYMTIGTAVLMAVLLWNLTRSRIGRAFVALRDSEIGAEQMGVNVPFYKALAFGISSFYAGIGGGLFFVVQTFVAPESLRFNDSILFLLAVVIGGLGSILGSVFGALFLAFQAELISNLPDWIPGLSRVRDFERLSPVIYGSLLIVTILTFPRGLAGIVQSVRSLGRGGRNGALDLPLLSPIRGALRNLSAGLLGNSDSDGRGKKE